MHTTLHARPVLSWLASLALLLVVAAPAAARAPKTVEPASSPTPTCDHPCAHVADCPKVTCECDGAAAAGVAACDTDVTHCCVAASTACERFCEINHQKWTGRFTPEGGATSPDAAGNAPEAAAPSSCEAPCQKGEDCRTITCQCTHGTVPDVAACDARTRCCGDARVVCEHYCTGKKGKWTGKVAETPVRQPDTRSLLGEPDDDGLDDSDDSDDLRP